jgi:transcriptional regulator with XRE-family HTH domain
MSKQAHSKSAPTGAKRATGRPTFHIDASVLQALREEAGLTQLGLAQRVYARAGRQDKTSHNVMKTSASRWEASGTVQVSLVPHLAEALGVTKAMLQGNVPPPERSRIDEFERLIKERISESGANSVEQALQQFADEQSPERELAESLAHRLELAQLTQLRDEFQAISELTGLTQAELRRPTSHSGVWMLVGSGIWGAIRHELLRGVAELLFAVRQEIESAVKTGLPSDTVIGFREERPWFVVTWSHPRYARLSRTLRFVRCQPVETGIRWASPTNLDRLWLEELPAEVMAAFNFVRGFDGVMAPSSVDSMRLVLRENPSWQEYEELGDKAQAQTLAVVSVNLEYMRLPVLDECQAEGTSHELMVNWLCSDLWSAIAPHLAKWPLKCWSMRASASRIEFLLDVPPRLWRDLKEPPPMGNRLSLVLAELLPDGSLKRAPWRESSVKTVFERLSQDMREQADRAGT